MGTKSRETIYGASVRAAGERATEARKAADRLAVEARTRMDEFVTRRTKMAETKIAQAEAQALADVRAAAADAAVAAAQSVIAARLTPEAADSLVKQGIDALKSKLN